MEGFGMGTNLEAFPATSRPKSREPRVSSRDSRRASQIFIRSFDCPIIWTDTNSQCYFVRQCMLQQRSLANWVVIFVDNC